MTGCTATQKFLTMMRDFSVGVYTATAEQIRVANQRATAAFSRFSPERKEELKASETRYLAVRTLDPTPAQKAEIKADMAKPSSRYGPRTGGAPPKVYCVMIWDTQTREIVGTKCYATLSLPKDGEISRFDTYTAQYVGLEAM